MASPEVGFAQALVGGQEAGAQAASGNGALRWPHLGSHALPLPLCAPDARQLGHPQWNPPKEAPATDRQNTTVSMEHHPRASEVTGVPVNDDDTLNDVPLEEANEPSEKVIAEGNPFAYAEA